MVECWDMVKEGKLIVGAEGSWSNVRGQLAGSVF
jgi:2-polyprenyl-6-methoxyphenol hydroxylase-like FAD-dependent oxidoreductase